MESRSYEDCQQGMQQSLAALADIVNEFKETQVPGQFLLRNASVRPQPGAQQRPKAIQGVDMDFMKTISIFVTSILASRVVDFLMLVAPFGQAIVDIIFIRIDLAARCHVTRNDRLDCHLLYIG